MHLTAFLLIFARIPAELTQQGNEFFLKPTKE